MRRWVQAVSLILVVVGALNWGLVGLFEFDLVAELVGEEFGETNAVSRIVYILVGLAGLALAAERATAERESATRPAAAR